MKSTIAPAEDTRETPASASGDGPGEAPTPRQLVKLSVVIDEHDFDRDIDQAFRKIGREATLPGFRAGKVPRKVLEARIGLAAARDEALRDAVPAYLAQAVREHDIDLIATPEVEITGGADEGPVSFDAVCEVRPVITVPGYGGLRVELPSPVATEAEIDEAVDAERRRQGSLVDVTRPVQAGDHVTLTLAGTREGEPVPGLNTEDWLYEVGKGWVAEGFDDRLVGSAAGAELSFSANPSGMTDPADFEVTISNVQELVLPEVTDEWVSENLGEFDTVQAWRESIAQRIGASKLNQARNQFIERTTTALAALVDVPAPESMVTADLQARVQNTVQQFQAQGISIDQWLSATGQDAGAFIEALKVQSVKAVKVDLALRAVAEAEAIEITPDDINAEYARIAVQVRQKASEVRKAYEKNDAVTDLVAQMRKSKALDWLLEHAEVVDETGAPVDTELLMGKHDHDHDHDHDH
ncbi:MAG: trigger factor, partial [Actinomycetota bacterium]|nr:trigger factor [Actinomycetota bacterium]